MKKMLALALVLVCAACAGGCKDDSIHSAAETESVSADYGRVVEMAKEEFALAFGQVEIEEISTMARTDDEKEIVVQFKFAAGNENGVYGFLYRLDEYDYPELVQQGEEITVENLLG